MYIFLVFGVHLAHDVQNYPSLFQRINLSSGMSALKYAPGISNIAIYIPLCTSIMSPVNQSSREMAGEDTWSLMI